MLKSPDHFYIFIHIFDTFFYRRWFLLAGRTNTLGLVSGILGNFCHVSDALAGQQNYSVANGTEGRDAGT